MKKFLFDTNTLSTLLKRHDKHHDKLISKLKTFDYLDETIEIYVSILSIFEMEYGVAHAKNFDLEREAKKALMFLKAQSVTQQAKLKILPLTLKQAEIFGQVKEQFQVKKAQIGEKIGNKTLSRHNIDLMIAAMAIEHNAILISNDKKMFEFIQNIRSDFQWENWI